jgi:hypothetical protein
MLRKTKRAADRAALNLLNLMVDRDGSNGRHANFQPAFLFYLNNLNSYIYHVLRTFTDYFTDYPYYLFS